ncbi:MAG: ABC transporter permease [Paramuribaculum sp.]|nr:ABC transporter permease [Paramuribaculum sp.]
MKNAIFDWENWREIGSTLSRNKTRTFLTAFGIFWGVAMLAVLWGGSSGLEGMMKRNFQGFATNMGGCFPQRTTMSYRGFNKGMDWSMNQDDVDFIRRTCPLIEYSSTLNFYGSSVKYGTKSTAGRIMGVESDMFDIQIPVLHEGRVINQSDITQTRKVAVLGKNKADELFSGESPIGKFVSIDNIYFKVIGVVSQKSDASIGGNMDDSIIIPSTTMRRTFNMGKNINFMIYTMKSGHTPKDIEPYVWRAVRSNHPLNPNDNQAVWFMDISENFKMADNLFFGIGILALFVGIGTLLAGIIGVGNIMWIIVKERTQEIGIRRAIGAKPRDIIVQILSEGMILTAIAGIAGICFATLILYVADQLTFDPIKGSANFQLQFHSSVTIMLLFLILGTAAGLIPAIKAMRIKPIEALNDK